MSSGFFRRFARPTEVVLAVAALATQLADASLGDQMIAVQEQVTGAIARTQHLKNQETVSAHTFGMHPLNSAAANTTAMQKALDHLREVGGRLVIPFGVYAVNGLVSLVEDAPNSPAQTWVIEGEGSTLTWAASGLTAGSALKIGADSLSHVHEAGFGIVRNLKLIGPETSNPTVSGGVTFPAAGTTMIGLDLEYALDVSFENVYVRRFFKGMKARFCWPINARGLNLSANYIGLHLGSVCTLGNWDGCSAQNCAFPVLMQPDATGDNIEAQTFIGMRIENSLRGFTMDPLSSGVNTTTIRNITIFSPRFEQVAYDLVRVGKEFVYATPQSDSADRTDYCQGLFLKYGSWDDPVGAGTHYAVRASVNGYVRGGDITIPIGARAMIAGSLVATWINILPNPNGGVDSGSSFFPQGSKVAFGGALELGPDNGTETVANNSTAWSIPNGWNVGGNRMFMHASQDWMGLRTATRVLGSEQFVSRGISTFYNPSNSGGSQGFGFYSDVTAPATKHVEISNNGNVMNTNNSYGSMSDRRVKSKVVPAQSQLDDVVWLGANLRNFEVDDMPGLRQLGLVAQEVQEVCPGLVEELETGLLAVKYSVASVKALGAIAELAARVVALERERAGPEGRGT